ncbi:hypothetical protein KP509_11G087200 [Ceratopteris richardii]|nr:hypothetical protein KP509_11G087200 [Ceratopteris richardii]
MFYKYIHDKAKTLFMAAQNALVRNGGG